MKKTLLEMIKESLGLGLVFARIMRETCEEGLSLDESREEIEDMARATEERLKDQLDYLELPEDRRN